VNAESETLITIRRKLIRWAEDLRELPGVDRPQALANRKGDNWYPLRQIAALAGDEWTTRAREAAIGSSAASASIGALIHLINQQGGLVGLNTADALVELTRSGRGTAHATASSSTDFPQFLSGAWIARRGEMLIPKFCW
jgi:Protein of unknown function (DUF3631)